MLTNIGFSVFFGAAQGPIRILKNDTKRTFAIFTPVNQKVRFGGQDRPQNDI